MNQKTNFNRAERAVDEWLATKNGRTRSEYTRDISRYVTYCVDRSVDPLKARPDTAAGWLASLEADYHLSSATRLRALRVVSGFYSYAIRWDYAKKNPFWDVSKPKPANQTALGMSMDESQSLVREAFWTSERLHALVVTLLLLGVRVSELLNADIEDIQSEGGQRVLRILPKGRDEKVLVPLPDMAFAAIMAYVGDRTSGPIFITRTGRRLSRTGAYDTIVRLGVRAGIQRLFPHLIRATTTGLLLALGVKLERVQEVMRHKDPKTTIGYDRQLQHLRNSPVFILEKALNAQFAMAA
ncbi:tyrosine recombinase XerC [Streptomyces xanthochromogenes]|uniref:tyrosine-type recombinase/integrase n=1 Tax=Streptomyces xanthochromogenes TaxID=67384 RepID=UPI001671DC84|nr:tyrosine-type recombinase/integrase [Streptomyces xanthochromogenes]GHB52157.1 tyrosine recombinase XerC [Streptomyces xanthochromogenes]